jgi:phage terminase Nu1 subunit (DNA packaging protein)
MDREEDLDKLLSLIDSTKGDVFKSLLDKLKKGDSLAGHELKLLEKVESEIKAKKAGESRRVIKTQKALAEYLSRSERTIAYYKNQGMPVNLDGTYDLDAIDAWFDDRKEKGTGQPHGGKPDTGDKSGWEAVYKEMKARIAELELRKLSGELISREEVYQQFVARILEIGRALSALSRKLPPLLEGKEKRDMEEIIEGETRIIRERFARPGGHLKGSSKLRIESDSNEIPIST